MRAMKKAAQLFGVMAIAVGCLGVATEVKAGEFRGGGNHGGNHNGNHGGGHHNNGQHGGGFRPGYGYGGGFRPGFGYGGYRPGWGGGFYPGGFNRGGFVYNRPGDGRPPIFIPR